MRGSLKILSVRGIDIRVHFTFPLILIWAAVQFGLLSGGGLIPAFFGVIAVTLLFVIVTLHELGHSFAALHYGIPVERIVLLPIGGVAQLKEMPEKPSQEFVIAAAGPAVNFGLAIILGLIASIFGINLASPGAILAGLESITFESLFGYMFFYNLLLAVFNLLPAFPMDGGRILRALMAMRLDYTRATSIAARIGRALAVLMGIYGLFNGAFFTVLIAIFIYSGAGQEEAVVRGRSYLRGIKVWQAYSRQVYTLTPYHTLQDAINLSLSGFQKTFPVLDNGRLVGLLTYPQLVTAVNEMHPRTLLSGVMMTSFPTVGPNDDLVDVHRLMTQNNIEVVPVVDGGNFLGLISRYNLNQVTRFVKARPNILPRSMPA